MKKHELTKLSTKLTMKQHSGISEDKTNSETLSNGEIEILIGQMVKLRLAAIIMT